MNEQQPPETPRGETVTASPERPKSRIVRLDEELYSQLRFVAGLTQSTVTDEVRRAVQERIATAQNDPELAERAEQVRQEIEQETATRTAAIAEFLGKREVAKKVIVATNAGSRRRASNPENE